MAGLPLIPTLLAGGAAVGSGVIIYKNWDKIKGWLDKLGTGASEEKSWNPKGKSGESKSVEKKGSGYSNNDIPVAFKDNEAIGALSKNLEEEKELLEDVLKHFKDVHGKFSEIATLQKEKIEALLEFEDPRKWDNYEEKRVKEDIDKMRKATKKIPELLGQIADSTKMIQDSLMKVEKLFEKDINLLDNETREPLQKVSDNEQFQHMRPEIYRENETMRKEQIMRAQQHVNLQKENISKVNDACERLAAEITKYKNEYWESEKSKALLDEEKGVMGLHNMFKDKEAEENTPFYAVIKEEMKNLKELFIRFNAIEMAIQNFFINGKVIAESNQTAKDNESAEQYLLRYPNHTEFK